MKSLVVGLLLWIALPAAAGWAQIDVKVQPEMQVLVLMLKEPISLDNGLPMAQVRLGKILLRDGGFVRELPLRFNEMKLLPEMLKEQFRLYRGPKQFGIYKYQSVPDTRKPKKNGDYLSAIPVDKDATVLSMTAKTRDQADILNLLNMTIEEAASAVQNEARLNKTLANAESAEVVLLQTGKLDKAPLFFVPVKQQQ